MKHILTIILCTASCFCYGQERRQTESREGWWNDNPSFVVPIREIGVTARRPMKEIGVQKTRLDTLVLHETRHVASESDGSAPAKVEKSVADERLPT